MIEQIISSLNLDTIVLMLGSLTFAFLLVQWHKDDSQFSIKSVIADPEGKFSLSKFGQFVSMITSTWVVIHQTRAGTLTEWLFTGYMIAWAGANAFSKYLENKRNNQ